MKSFILQYTIINLLNQIMLRAELHAKNASYFTFFIKQLSQFLWSHRKDNFYAVTSLQNMTTHFLLWYLEV